MTATIEAGSSLTFAATIKSVTEFTRVNRHTRHAKAETFNCITMQGDGGNEGEFFVTFTNAATAFAHFARANEGGRVFPITAKFKRHQTNEHGEQIVVTHCKAI